MAKQGTAGDVSGNLLYYGDNLDILRRYVDDESVDLIYLDPPFNSNADYNVLFAEKDGSQANAQITAFEDTWQWGLEAEQEYAQSQTGVAEQQYAQSQTGVLT